MEKTIYASDLGKCYAKAENGFYRLYREARGWGIGCYSLFLVTKEDGRLTATWAGYVSELENFAYAVDEVKAELAGMDY
jgi:hypothetical protein